MRTEGVFFSAPSHIKLYFLEGEPLMLQILILALAFSLSGAPTGTTPGQTQGTSTSAPGETQTPPGETQTPPGETSSPPGDMLTPP
jgi:hypothetical protein